MPQFETLVEGAIEKLSMGEDIDWEVGILPHPQLGPCWVVVLVLDTPIVGGDPFTFTSILANMTKALEPGKVEQALGEGLDKLRTERSKVLTAPAAPAAPGGPQAPQTGPLLPPGVSALPPNGKGAQGRTPGF